MPKQIVIPELGESITEVQIATWHKREGDTVEKDEDLVSIESDKATVELPSPAAGTLSKILKSEGEDAKVGDVIGEIGENGDDANAERKSKTTPKRKKDRREEADASEAEKQEEVNEGGPQADTSAAAAKSERTKETGKQKIMPAAKRLLEEHELSAEDIEATGPGGRLLKEDVLTHLEGPVDEDKPSKPQAKGGDDATDGIVHEKVVGGERGASELAPSGKRQEEIVRMSPLRRTVARRLVEAQHEMAMLTTFNEVDMSAVVSLRKSFKEAFEGRYGVRLGLMSFFVKAVIAGLKENIRLNAELRGDEIVLHHYFDVGVAIGAGKGLVVPVIRNAEDLSFAGIEKAIADFGARASESKLKPEELEGGTFTISNGGVYGSLLSTPIINPPQSAILGLHAIQDRPVVVEGEVVIRPMMYIALSYDHRIVDGREGVTFLRRVKEFLESPPRLLLEV